MHTSGEESYKVVITLWEPAHAPFQSRIARFSVSIHPLEHGLKWSDLAFLRIFIGKLDDCEVSFK